MTNTTKPAAPLTLAAAERAFAKAHRAEMKYVDALTSKATPAQYARAWALADAANAARRMLATLRSFVAV